MSIEGIPEGWELVKFDVPQCGDWVLDPNGEPLASNCDGVTVWPIIRKIEKPKQYRAFANKAEYTPHRDRLIINKHCGNDDTCSSYRITDFDGEGVCFGGSSETYEEVFGCYVFDNFDGTTEPFGVEVTE